MIRDSKGRFVRAPEHDGPAALGAMKAEIAQSLTEKGLNPMGASLTDRPVTIEELRACVTGRCRGASLALSDIIRIDPKGQSTNYREALARYTVWTEARTMAQSVIDAQARDKRRRGLWSRIFG